MKRVPASVLKLAKGCFTTLYCIRFIKLNIMRQLVPCPTLPYSTYPVRYLRNI